MSCPIQISWENLASPICIWLWVPICISVYVLSQIYSSYCNVLGSNVWNMEHDAENIYIYIYNNYYVLEFSHIQSTYKFMKQCTMSSSWAKQMNRLKIHINNATTYCTINIRTSSNILITCKSVLINMYMYIQSCMFPTPN